MNLPQPGPWEWESDGEAHERTYYAWRENPAFPCGIQRRDFDSAKAARAFIAAEMEHTP